ncbi:uncharacterized protein LOC127805888 [Diospyros lotus]|uniref:uncharacterized protein LOC127805888 n=1 Tax=Diospyros lotus TaxID=55363 RepID=UPI002258223A|nr:uncharacterized protein LOC127805888 [Diospyros lotus]
MGSGAGDHDDQSKDSKPPPPQPPLTGNNNYPPMPPPMYPHPHPGHPPPPYPGYPQNYPAYNPNGYPFAAPPPAAYYHAQQEQEAKARLSVARFILTMMIFLVIGTFALSLLTWLVFGAHLPTFHVESMKVPSFNISNDLLNAKWDANITVKNYNSKMELTFDYFEGIIVYDDMILGLARVQPFRVGIKKETSFNIKLSTQNGDQESLAGNYQDLVGDRKEGVLYFDLRMIAETSVRSGLMVRRRVLLKVFCEDLEIKFAGPNGPGALVQEDRTKQHECVTYL